MHMVRCNVFEIDFNGILDEMLAQLTGEKLVEEKIDVRPVPSGDVPGDPVI